MALLNTVRAKLTTLVALSAAAALASLPLLHWVMTRQLVDVADDRVPDAVRGFDLELEDDLKDLDAASRALAESPDLEGALARGDAKSAERALSVWQRAYPGMAAAALRASGETLASAGFASSFLGAPELDAKGAELRFLMPRGCGATREPRPAYVIARDLHGAGRAVVCMTFDEAYLTNSAQKLGLELAVEGEGGGVAYATADFPRGAARATSNGEPIEIAGREWAVARFEPGPLRDVKDRFNVVATLDVTGVTRVVRRNLFFAGTMLLLTALTAVIVGWRLARIMSDALTRINAALMRLKQSEYIHVSGVKTGDEIEALASGFNTMVDGLRERDKLRTTFGKYMTPAVIEHLLKGDVELGGESLKVTVLFTDIRGFTTISESMPPSDLVQLLNDYFTEMVAIVMDEGGVVDKYIGDAIMAVFGAPVPKPDDAKRAVRAAVRMRAALHALNAELQERHQRTLETGIGIHTGEVVAGNIGSEARMEYTVIGDTVNLASRLESATKELGVHVLISEDTHAELDDTFQTRALQSITVKGRKQPVMTYEVTGMKATAPKTERASRAEEPSKQPVTG